MYIKEIRNVLKNLGMAIDAMSRAEYTIRKSEVKTKADLEICDSVYSMSNNIREIRKELESIYAGIND